jgi:hypothetical protein
MQMHRPLLLIDTFASQGEFCVTPPFLTLPMRIDGVQSATDEKWHDPNRFYIHKDYLKDLNFIPRSIAEIPHLWHWLFPLEIVFLSWRRVIAQWPEPWKARKLCFFYWWGRKAAPIERDLGFLGLAPPTEHNANGFNAWLVLLFQLVDLHIYVVPPDLWRDHLNSAVREVINDTISAGFVRWV